MWSVSVQVGAPEGSSGDENTYASPPETLPTNLTNTREVVNADNERSLIVIRASGGSTDLSMGDGHFSTSLAVDGFEIEDLLVGPRCPRHAYLARSFVVTRETPHHAMRGAVWMLLLDLLVSSCWGQSRKHRPGNGQCGKGPCHCHTLLGASLHDALDCSQECQNASA